MNHSTDICQSTVSLLSAEGALQSILPEYTERRGQIEMARLTARAFSDEEIAVIQAGTGVGKSFAYLIPAILWAEHAGEAVVISTATTNLQDQLWQKDIPLLRSLFDFTFEAVVVKGAQQYICLDRLHDQSDRLPLSLGDEEQHQLVHIQEWAPESATGQKSDLPFEPSRRLWKEIEVSTTLCLYESCRFYNECAFIRERRRVNKAHILITNHSLLMSDLALRTQSEGFATILPEYSRLIIDEAHKFENAVSDSLSVTVNPSTVRELLTRIYDPAADDGFLARLRSFARLLPSGKGERTSFSRAISGCGETVASAMQAMEFFFERIVPFAGKLVNPNDAYTAKQSYGGDWLRSGDILDIRDNELENFTVLIDRLLTELYAFQLRLSSIGEDEETIRVRKEIQLYRSQIDQLGKGLHSLFDEENDDVRWIEMPPGRELLSFRSSPLSVDDFLGPFLFEQMKTILFTSATLAPGNTFEFFNRSVGLDAFETHRQTSAIVDSPFDYDANLMLLVPTDLPDPTSPSFEQSVASVIPRAVEASRGRALILFTSHSMLRNVYEAACGPIEALGYECIAQGTYSRAAALNRFRDTTSSVLFGTASFWDGIDVAGESLSLVVIVRIPFSVPNDPIVAARSAAIAENGKNPFLEFQLPGAAMRLQQGLGRLIRTHTDRGAVLFLDKRLITRQYGRYILDSLPRGIFLKSGIRECISGIERFLI